MYKSYIKVLIRSLLSAKLFTVVNLLGLSTGILAFLIISHYVKFESSFDNFHHAKKEIYRLTIEDHDDFGNRMEEFATISPGYGPMMKAYFAEVTDFTRLVSTRPFMSKPALKTDQFKYFEDRLFYADQQFLTMFSFPLVEGDVKTALMHPNSIVLSAKLAEKYFGSTSVVDKTITLAMGSRGSVNLKITGVMANLPVNSHINAEALISFNTLPSSWNLDQVMDWGDFYVYFMLSSAQLADQVASGLPDFLEASIGSYSVGSALKMQSLEDIYLDSNKRHEIRINGNRQNLVFLMLIGLVILVIAWINYVNLMQAKILEFVKEFGLRRMMGASTGQLFLQIFINTLFLNLIAFCIALTLAQLFLPTVYQFLDQPVNESIFIDYQLLLAVLGLVILGSVITAAYPLWLLRRSTIIDNAEGKLSKNKVGNKAKKTLLGFQLLMTAMLIAMTLTIYHQITLLKHQQLGIDINQKLVMAGPAQKDISYATKWEHFSTSILNSAGIKAVAVSSSIPGKELGWGRNIYQLGKAENEVPISIVEVDEHFFPLYDVNFIKGNNFHAGTNPNTNNVIVNQKALSSLGFESVDKAIGAKVAWMENGEELVFDIIGVVEDFKQQTGKYLAQPIIFPLKGRLNAPWADEFYTVSFTIAQPKSIISFLETKWNQSFPENPFDFFLLDNYYHLQYHSDEKFQSIFKGFTGLALLISMLGIFGLFNLSIVQRIKEIGIRKVLGASLASLFQLLLKDYFYILLVSLLLALPMAYYLANLWLQEFATKVELGYWFFIGPGLSLLGVIVLTLLVQVKTIASKNPVDALRYE